MWTILTRNVYEIVHFTVGQVLPQPGWLHSILYYMSAIDDTPAGMPSASEIAAAFMEIVDARRTKVEMAGRRVNIKPRRPVGYTYVYLDRMIGLGLTGKEWDLVFILASRADGKGLIVYAASEIGLELGLDNSQLHRHLRRVLQTGILERVGRSALRLNPRFLWHGSSATQVTLLSEQMSAELQAQWREDGVIP